jgi:hypothetical protein
MSIPGNAYGRINGHETRGPSRLSRDEVLKIARLDAERAYRDLTPFRICIALEMDGWHVDYELKDAGLNGGGPHYVIDPRTGALLARRRAMSQEERPCPMGDDRRSCQGRRR